MSILCSIIAHYGSTCRGPGRGFPARPAWWICLTHQLSRELVDGGELGFRRGGLGSGHCAPPRAQGQVADRDTDRHQADRDEQAGVETVTERVHPVRPTARRGALRG